MLKLAAFTLAALLPGLAQAATLDLASRDLSLGAHLGAATVDTAGDVDYFFAANAEGALQVIMDFLDLGAPFAGDNAILSLTTRSGDALYGTLVDFATDSQSSELLFAVNNRSGAFEGVSDLLFARLSSTFAIGTFGEDLGVTLSFYQTAPEIAAVPVPAAGLLLGTALIGSIALRRRK